MFIDHLLSADINNNPWPHVIIDPVFDPDDWKSIVETAGQISSEKFETGFHNKGSGDDTTSVGPARTRQLINNIMQQLSVNCSEILNKFNVYDKTVEYKVKCSWGITVNSSYKIHADNVAKALTVLIYISPETAIGTLLYTKKDPEAYHSTVPWKPNSALIFAPDQEKTWHSYHHNSDTPRLTLMFHLKKEEK